MVSVIAFGARRRDYSRQESFWLKSRDEHRHCVVVMLSLEQIIK